MLFCVTALAIGLRAIAQPIAPDGWDGVGFVESVTDFDLAAFRPHPPGYPLFVALARLAHVLGLSPLRAVYAVSLVFGALLPLAGYGLVMRAMRSADARLCATLAAMALACAPGCVVAGEATIPDGAALTLAVAAYAAALGPYDASRARALPHPPSDRASALTGLLVAASLGVRPSALLVALPALLLVPAIHRARGALVAALTCALGVASWAVPIACIVGASRWWALCRAQLSGHLSRWGESDASWSGTSGKTTAISEALSLQTLGIEGRLAASVALLLLAALAAWAIALLLRRRTRAPFIAIVLCLPYAIAASFTQPVAAAPRHALPITVAVIVAVALCASTLRARRAFSPALLSFALASTAVVVALFVRGLAAARTHAEAPAAVAMLRFVAHSAELAHAAVVSGRSSRFVAWGDGAIVAPGALAGDAIVFAMRADPLPDPLLVTSELDLRGVRAPRLQQIATFFRDSPLDRREREITLYSLSVLPK